MKFINKQIPVSTRLDVDYSRLRVHKFPKFAVSNFYSLNSKISRACIIALESKMANDKKETTTHSKYCCL